MLIPEDRQPTTPGEMLEAEFMEPLGLSQTALAKILGITRDAMNEIINGRRAITTRTALLLAKAFGTTPDFWLNGQLALDLYKAQHDADISAAVDRVSPIPCNA